LNKPNSRHEPRRKHTPATGGAAHPAAALYLDLAADGAELGGSQRSLPRRAMMLAGASLLLLGAPLSFATSAFGATPDASQAVLVKAAGPDGDDDDDARSGSGDDDDDDESVDGVTDGDSANSVSEQSAATDGVSTGDGVSEASVSADGTDGDAGPSTLGKTLAAADAATGVETQGNTDRGGQDTGLSTRGETDLGDKTGATEQTQGTGKETRGATDRPGIDTGVSTAGDSELADNTGPTERR